MVKLTKKLWLTFVKLFAVPNALLYDIIDFV